MTAAVGELARSRAAPRAAVPGRDAAWASVASLQASLAQRAPELEDAAVELLGVARRVARQDIALTERRLAAFPDLRALVEQREPLGAVALCLPGNAILSNPVATVLSAVLAGNAVRARLPRRRCAWLELLRELLAAAEVPAVEFVATDGRSFLAHSFDDPDVPLVMAFGADSWAAEYERQARLKETTFIFEGPGNDPFLVLDASSAEAAALDAVEAAFHNAGQACTSPERFYVVPEALDTFAEHVAEATSRLVTGDPRDEATDVGPVESTRRAAHVMAHVADAIDLGAELVCGGRSVELAVEGDRRTLVHPTVLLGVDHRSRLVQEETFGPVLPITPVASVKEAVELAEDSVYGLAASVYGGPGWTPRRLGRSHGTVFVGETWLRRDRRQPLAPYGGRKRSGWVWEWRGDTFVRRDGPRLNLAEFSVPRTRPRASSLAVPEPLTA